MPAQEETNAMDEQKNVDDLFSNAAKSDAAAAPLADPAGSKK